MSELFVAVVETSRHGVAQHPSAWASEVTTLGMVQAGQLAACTLLAPLTLPAHAFGVAALSCNFRVGADTGALLQIVKNSPNSPVELSIAYRVAVQVHELGVSVAHEQLESATFLPSRLIDEGRRVRARRRRVRPPHTEQTKKFLAFDFEGRRRLQGEDPCTGYARHPYAEVEVLAEPFQTLLSRSTRPTPDGQLTSVRLCSQTLSEVQADSGLSCAQAIEHRAASVGALAVSVEAQLHNPTAFALAVSDLSLVASYPHVPAASSHPLAPHPSTWGEDATILTLAQQNAIACELSALMLLAGFGWGNVSVNCELRLGDETGELIARMLPVLADPDATLRLSLAYRLAAEMVGVLVNDADTIDETFSLADMTAGATRQQRRVQESDPVASQEPGPFAEAEELLPLQSFHTRKCGTDIDDMVNTLFNNLHRAHGPQPEVAIAALQP